MGTLKKTLLTTLAVALLVGAAIAQVNYYREGDMAKMNAFAKQNGDTIFIVGGLLWPGLEVILKEKLAQKRSVRILTNQTEAFKLSSLARAGAVIRYGKGGTTPGKLMLFSNYLVMPQEKQFFIVEGREVTAPVWAQFEKAWQYGSSFKP